MPSDEEILFVAICLKFILIGYAAKVICNVIFLIAYQNFFCMERKDRFTRWRPSYVTIRFMEVQKWWIWGKREKTPLGSKRVTYMFSYHILHLLMFIWIPLLGTPQGRSFIKCFLHIALHLHSQESNSQHDCFYKISFITTSAYAFG